MDSAGEQYTGPLWNNEESRFRTVWRLLATLGLLAIASRLFQQVIYIGLARRPSGQLLETLWVTLLVVVAFAAGTAAVAGFSFIIDRRHLSDLGLEYSRRWWRELGVGLALGTVMVFAVAAVMLAAGFGTVTGYLSGTVTSFDLDTGSILLGTVFSVGYFLGIGVFEEVLIRGWLLVNISEGLRGYLGSKAATVVAVAITAVGFGLIHAGNAHASTVAVVNITLFGCLLGTAFVLTERLAIPIGIHVAWNVALGPVFGLPVSGSGFGTALIAVSETGPDVVTGGGFGPEAGLLGLVGLCVGIAGLWWWLDRQGPITVRESVAQPDLWADDGDGS